MGMPIRMSAYAHVHTRVWTVQLNFAKDGDRPVNLKCLIHIVCTHIKHMSIVNGHPNVYAHVDTHMSVRISTLMSTQMASTCPRMHISLHTCVYIGVHTCLYICLCSSTSPRRRPRTQSMPGASCLRSNSRRHQILERWSRRSNTRYQIINKSE